MNCLRWSTHKEDNCPTIQVRWVYIRCTVNRATKALFTRKIEWNWLIFSKIPSVLLDEETHLKAVSPKLSRTRRTAKGQTKYYLRQLRQLGHHVTG